jgi:hypothetical protein
MERPTSKKTKKNHLRGQTTRGTSSSQTTSCCHKKHIKSNKERGGGPPQRRPSLGHSLEQPSTIATTHLKDKKRVGELKKKKTKGSE